MDLKAVSAPPDFDPEAVTPPGRPVGPWDVVSLALDVSGSCNLACRYCAEGLTQPRRPPMTDEVLDAAWRFLAPGGTPPKPCSVRLGSGEPLLNLPLLQRLTWIVEHGAADAPALFLTTNGTLLSPRVCEWLAETGWHVKVSLDGPAAVHDLWRVTPTGEGTYHRLVGPVRQLAQQLGDRFSVTAVLCRGADPGGVFAAIADLGVRRIELVPVAAADPAILPDWRDLQRYRRFLDEHVGRLLEEGGAPPPTLIRLQDRIGAAMGLANSYVGCAAGRAFLGVGPGGELYPCFRFIGLEPYRLGSLETGLDTEAVAAFASRAGRPWDERSACQACWAAPLCGGPCFAVAECFGPGDGEPLGLHCDYVRADSWAAVRVVQELQHAHPERLLAFLPVAPGLE
jgi:uncharacterized protein